MTQYSDIAQGSALLVTFVTAFVTLAPERVKAEDYTATMAAFSVPMASLLIALGAAVIESGVALFAFYAGLVSLFAAFIYTITKMSAVTSAEPIVAKGNQPRQEGDSTRITSR